MPAIQDSERLRLLRELCRADPEIKVMCDIVSREHGGLAMLAVNDPETFAILCDEVDSILQQLGGRKRETGPSGPSDGRRCVV